jgi:hypothetical protein
LKIGKNIRKEEGEAEGEEESRLSSKDRERKGRGERAQQGVAPIDKHPLKSLR